MKLWLDEVLAFGWAYGPGGTALRGKDLWLVATTGGAEDSYRPDSYNRYFFDAFLPPYEQTAALCGMRFLPPLLLHGAHRASEAEIAAHAERLRRSGSPSYPTGRRSTTLPSACADAARCRPTRAADRAPSMEGRLMEHGRLADRQPRLPRRRGDRGAAGAAPRPRLDHRLPRRRHRDRALGPGAGHRPAGHPALRRVRRGADAVPGRPGARAAAAVVAAQADLRLGQRAAVRLGAR